MTVRLTHTALALSHVQQYVRALVAQSVLIRSCLFPYLVFFGFFSTSYVTLCFRTTPTLTSHVVLQHRRSRHSTVTYTTFISTMVALHVSVLKHLLDSWALPYCKIIRSSRFHRTPSFQFSALRREHRPHQHHYTYRTVRYCTPLDTRNSTTKLRTSLIIVLHFSNPSQFPAHVKKNSTIMISKWEIVKTVDCHKRKFYGKFDLRKDKEKRRREHDRR